MLRSTRAVAASKTVRVSAARVCPVSVPSASTIPCTKADVLYTPPFATVFIMAVICSGVTVSAPWPKLNVASSPGFSSAASGSVPDAPCRPGASCVAVPKPSVSAILRMRCAPSRRPSSMK